MELDGMIFDRVKILAQPVALGAIFNTPRADYKVTYCAPNPDGGFWVGLECAVLYATDINGNRT